MERFDGLIERNQIEKGGSFYLQSKIFWAKEHLMKDFAAELNESKWNPGAATEEPEEE